MIPQRQLVFELKHAIDVCQRRPYDQRAARHLAQLTDDPGAWSRHVQHNIGKQRAEWLHDWGRAQARPLPSQPEARSLDTR